MTLSAARQTANTANAQLSSGPKTADGKARSAQNALKHGLTAKDLVIGPEDREEFDELLAGFKIDVAPQGTIQQTLFDELVAAAWNLRRVRVMETELCSHAATYQDLLSDDELQSKLDRLARHKSRIERTFHRSLKELKALQTNLVVQAITGTNHEAAPPLASAIEISKRTHRPNDAAVMNIAFDAIDLECSALDAASRANMRANELEKRLAAAAVA
jgi:hypothetical protein